MKIRHKINLIVYAFIYIIFFISIYYNIKTGYIGGDDPFTLAISRHHFLNIMGLTSQDVHPFLYYFLARISIVSFNKTSSQIISLKILSALPYFILLIISSTTIKHQFSKKVSFLFMFFIVSMPIISQNIFVARMYGWALLFITLIFILFVYINDNVINNSVINFCYITLLSLAALYTHYYCLIIVFLLYVLFLFIFICSKRKIRYLIYSFLFTCALYIPWTEIMFKQISVVHHQYWSAPLDINPVNLVHVIIKLILEMFNNTYSESNVIKLILISFILSAIVLILLYVVKNICINNHFTITIFGLLLPIIIIITGILLSIIEKHQVFQARYLTPTLGIFWLCVSIVITLLLNNNNVSKLFKIILMILIVVIGFNSYYANILQLKSFHNQFRYTQIIFRHIPYNTHIIYNEPQVLTQTSVYLQNDKVYTLGDIYNGKPIGNPLVYRKVLKNDYIKHNITLNTKRHTYIFVRTLNDKNINSLGEKFFNKYEHHLYKIGNIYTPLAIKKSIVYVIK